MQNRVQGTKEQPASPEISDHLSFFASSCLFTTLLAAAGSTGADRMVGCLTVKCMANGPDPTKDGRKMLAGLSLVRTETSRPAANPVPHQHALEILLECPAPQPGLVAPA